MVQLSELDYSQPLATLFRDNMKEEHDVLATSDAARLLGKGELPKEEYVRLLMMLWYIYSALEDALNQHASNPALEPTYNPSLLARAPALSSDISHLLEVSEEEWKSHPIHVKLVTDMPPALRAYTDRVKELASASTEDVTTTPAQLLSHAYVRYLGDLSGGQSIRYILAKAYQLDVDSHDAAGPGVSFYAFKSLYSSELANQGEMKRIKQWFRDGVNTAGEILGEKGKQALVAETKKAFHFNGGLLGSLSLPATIPETDTTSDSITSKSSAISEKPSSPSPANSGRVSHILAALTTVYLTIAIWSGSVPELLGLGRWFLSLVAPGVPGACGCC